MIERSHRDIEGEVFTDSPRLLRPELVDTNPKKESMLRTVFRTIISPFRKLPRFETPDIWRQGDVLKVEVRVSWGAVDFKLRIDVDTGLDGDQAGVIVMGYLEGRRVLRVQRKL